MYENLERIEWTNCWREDSQGKERVLLIGDSITNGYKSLVHKKLDGKLCVSAIMTSKSLANPHLLEEIGLLAKQEDYAYKIIHFNSGLHSGGQSQEEYGENLEKAILWLQKTFPNAVITLANSTPTTVRDNPNEFIQGSVQKYNAEVARLGEKYGLAVDDLYSVVYGKPEVRVPDGYHYAPAGYDLLSTKVTEFLLANLS